MIYITEIENVKISNNNYQQVTSSYLTNSNNFVQKTITINGIQTVDMTKRNCKIHKDKFMLDFMIKIPYEFKFNERWELLSYQKDGFFDKHKDKQIKNNHRFTALLYPKSLYTGGELILYGDISTIVINSSINNGWYLIIFPIDMEHESLPVLSGLKYVFKTEVMYDEDEAKELKYENEQLCD